MVVEIRRRLQDAKSVCVMRRHRAMSAGEVLQGELDAAACFFYLLLVADTALGAACC